MISPGTAAAPTPIPSTKAGPAGNSGRVRVGCSGFAGASSGTCARSRWWKYSRPFTNHPSRGPWNDGGGKLPRARLSAMFPLVTPAARAPLAGKQFHLIDGGYYDNYGISSLLEWLDQALRNPAGPWHVTTPEKRKINEEGCRIEKGTDSTKGCNGKTVKT